jgi:arylsulfatase A-like enzyme
MRRVESRLALMWLGLAACCGSIAVAAEPAPGRRPNLLVILTDDMGHGDLGVHGNPVIKTPNLDRLAGQSVRLTRFHVSPVCSPTRSSLLTGRYNYRTRVVDTFNGRSMMDPAEVTLAEILGAAGYRTGIFGKWHLGDCYPMRAIDQGFQEALVLKGGGIGQPSDPPGGSSYFDPVLQHNGTPEKRKGYCSDVYTDAAIDYIAQGRGQGRPFFVYLAYNCPHDPLEVPESYRALYAGADLSRARFPQLGYPLPGPIPRDITARVYGMVTNIDDNVGRLLARLDELGLARDTIVLFLTDNGPAQVRYTSGMRGRKGTVYDGGIRVPAFLRWPSTLAAGKEVDRIAAHIDIVPTLLEACGVARPDGLELDGVSLWPLLTGRVAAAGWPDRTLFFQWHRGDVPERFRAFAARDQQYKLVRAEGPAGATPPAFELFDMAADPFEMHDIAAAHPDVVARLKGAYSAWFDDVSRTRGYDPPRIHVGSPRERITTLTRQDWRGPLAGAGPEVVGHWEIEVERAIRARVTLTLRPALGAGVAHLRVGGASWQQRVDARTTECVFEAVDLAPGASRLEAWLEQESAAHGAWSVEVKPLD